VFRLRFAVDAGDGQMLGQTHQIKALMEEISNLSKI
jgi:hypothetical protein